MSAIWGGGKNWERFIVNKQVLQNYNNVFIMLYAITSMLKTENTKHFVYAKFGSCKRNKISSTRY
jgi:hypothetical protein